MKCSFAVLALSSIGFATGVCQFPSDQNCFTILVGKNASTDGSVFVAHNEDDLNDHNFVDLHKVPRIKHAMGERQVFLSNADSILEAEETFAYFWITGSQYIEEQYLNEWGVAITSNSSRSNVQNGNGRIGHNLRRIVIERARTAREAVTIAGTLVERYGYASSGRVYVIADPGEAWVFEVANGKHWLARRVPDDEVAIIPNYYVIDEFHEQDTANFLASPGLVEYAIRSGWYVAQNGSSFNFRTTYGHKDRLDAIWNIARKWVILNQLASDKYHFNADFPFSIKPRHKIDIQTLIDALGNHYENTQFAGDACRTFGSPHTRSGLGVTDTLAVCNLYNDYSCITQLRSWLPPEIGNVSWIAPRYPCIQPFIPWYYGIDSISSDYEKATYTEALANFNNKNRNYIALCPEHACWVFDDFANTVDSACASERKSIQEWKVRFQMDVMKAVQENEALALRLSRTDHNAAVNVLTKFSNGCAGRALAETKERLLQLRAHGR